MAALCGADFDTEVVRADGLVLVDFWAPGCIPCAFVVSLVEDVAARTEGRLTVRALDVDAHPAPAARHAVLSLPTLILFRDGKEVARLTGTPSASTLDRTIAPHLEPR